MKWTYLFVFILLVGMVNALSIDSPEDVTYTSGSILLTAEHNETLDSIDYTLNDEDFDGCTDCSLLNITLDLDNGNHTLVVEGVLGNVTFTDEVEFIVDIEPVFSISIIQPLNQTYNTTIISLSIKADKQLDKIDYEIDEASATACTNCEEFNRTLNLSAGVHTIKTLGFIDDVVMTDEVTLEVVIPVLPVEFSITIDDPKAETYNDNLVLLSISADKELEEIYYILGNATVEACINCTTFNDTLNLTDGVYVLTVFGMLDNTTKNDSVEFEVNTVQLFTIDIISPEAKTYYDKEINVDIEANTTLDELYAEIGSLNWTCTNCSRLNDTVELDYGNYTLKVQGLLDEVSKVSYVDFRVVEKINDTDDEDNETGESRFTTGFEKLPQAVANGELTDEELADIIRDNKLNPGIINRLIKTGMLGNESLNAILDTQFTPPGIFKKLWSWIGFKVNTHASLIAETYDLDNITAKKVIDKEDLPKVQARIRNEVHVQNENKVAPGQAKKIQMTTQNSEDDSSKKIPPGQAKKINDTKGNGKGQGNK